MEDNKQEQGSERKNEITPIGLNVIEDLLSNPTALKAFLLMSAENQKTVNLLLHNIGCDKHPLNAKH